MVDGGEGKMSRPTAKTAKNKAGKAQTEANKGQHRFLKKPKNLGGWLGYGVVTVILLGLLALGLYGVHEFKDGRFAWMAQDKSRFINRIFSPKVAPEIEDYVIERMVPIHDDQKSRIREFDSDIERQCYLAFAGSICGFSREARRARISVEALINREGRADGDAQVLECAKGSKRYRDEMASLRVGMPHCLTVRDIVREMMVQ